MTRSKLFTALICLLLPGLLTIGWFYSNVPNTQSSNLPDYPTIDIPQPPVSTLIPRATPPAVPSTTILFDMSHSNMATLSEIDPFIRFIEAKGGEIRVTENEFDLAQLLKSANAYVTLAPIQGFSGADIAAIKEFVYRGGKLIVSADPTRNVMSTENPTTGYARGFTSVEVSNILLEPFDISIADDYLYDMSSNEGNFRNVIFKEFENNDLTRNINQLVIYGGHSVTSNGNSLATNNETTFSSATDQSGKFSPFALVKYGQGSVLAIGDFSLLTSQYIYSADNQVFANNLADFITQPLRSKTLADFPRLFSGKILIQPVKKMDVDGEFLTVVSKLESLLDTREGDLTISREDKSSVDRIILSTFDSKDNPEDIIKALKLNLKPESVETASSTPVSTLKATLETTRTPLPEETVEEPGGNEEFATEVPTELKVSGSEIEVPGMGRLASSELGLVGLVHEKDRTTLIIMAETPEKTRGFVKEIALNQLTGCFVFGNVAACKVTGSDLEPKG